MNVQYLEALGLDLWLPRARASATPATAARVAPPPAAPAVKLPVAPPVDDDWQSLGGEVRGCVQCGLAATRTQTVFGVGNRQAELLVVGEAPGAEEDARGEPFVGRAGQLLNAILGAMRWPRESVYIANILKCRPPGNRDPKPEEVQCCLPFLHRQIALIQPLVILAVGRIAAQNLLATDTQIGKLRGVVHDFGARHTPLIVTYHPSYLLRSPGEKRKAWTDMKFLRHELERRRAAAASGTG